MKLLTSIGLALAVLASPIAAQDTPKPVKLMQVHETAPGFTRQFFGRVAARQTVDLAFQVAGQIVEMPVNEGFVIPKDGLIARLDQEPFELRLNRARLQKEQADRTVARLSRLRGTAASQVAVDDAETEAQLAAIALRDAEYDLEHATLTAPFDALVSSRAVEAFTTVSSGSPIVRIHDMSELRIEVDVPEILFQRSNQNEDIAITAKFPVSEEVFPLEIREFDAETSSVGQTFRIQFGLTPPEGLQILPGSSVTVNVHVKDERKGIVVPATAIVVDATGELSVMVFSPTGADEGSVRRVPVTIEPTQTGDIRVLTGLSDGDEVVVAGGAVLTDGQAVRRFTGFAN
ncbi:MULTISPECIES: efflux RND transporter periplasmic adaptor subunit [unclassified Ruegeria]|uniref:efflux RND transporter periplasmic adaptor subunit n=1 Tax=unclassified Ruegeria TaxID=2625375 RepID=UPI001487B5C0|nr:MULTISPECIES: efflux RND transporter periplasmic adaptor subunit [unclassified Ruegeria]NOD62260.1 efflux RND transporter periplasmic adaptor subunit [Ruegeria sp. HKCCD6109]NOD75746.1 efflux RND transporter periplasmic adaptor subunit [Ruegeria sp. HKCCD4332]NOD88943.1 efflux RND transporter periplasmic adaptor subunit [Ruegeria sp. HKCCD4318]NOE14471.1 efflux RND transporter periplasmic adaptor subunit [Ruegeria sp. HKCCD4318-2]NOG10008.1 efflux RND transporter periplasmic adaptor subunit